VRVADEEETVRSRKLGVGVTDADADGFGELTSACAASCRSAVSPVTFRPLVLEDGEKDILRGGSDGAGDPSGTPPPPEPEPAAQDWPAPLYEHTREHRVWYVEP